MTREEFVKLTENGMIILDGATGSMLQKKGMPAGVCPEKWILDNPDKLIEVQSEYLSAGSDIIYAPTFTGNRIKLEEFGLENDAEYINKELVRLSKKAAAMSGKPCYVAGDMTMTGEQLYPIGTMKFEELVDIYKEQAAYLYEAGVDLIVVETMMSLQECRAAVLAIREVSNLPVMVTLSFQEDGRTLFGTDPATAVNVLQSMGADAVGANCSFGADIMAGIIEKMVEVATVPVIAKPNCGMPTLCDGKTVYSQTREEFAEGIKKLIETGAVIVGGCCGTDPQCISMIKDYVSGTDTKAVLEKVKSKRERALQRKLLSSERKTIDISDSNKFYIIGERINPTGKKKLQEAYREGDLEYITMMAEEQEEYGADILDINAGTNGIDERKVLNDTVTAVSQATDLPLAIDTSNTEAMETALRNYPGRALVNSISLDEERMPVLLDLAKKYGAMFILLPLSEKGLPKDINEKKHIINIILEKAEECGIRRNDIIVDGLVTTVGANKLAALETLETIRYCRNELGLSTVCGLSNISFGLPDRHFVNAAFVAMAIKEGLTMAIANPMQELLMNIIYSSDMLLNREGADERYVERITEFNPAHVKEEKVRVGSEGKPTPVLENTSTENDVYILDRDLYTAVLKGRKEQTMNETKRLAVDHLPEDIISNALVPAINEVGRLYEKGRYFLPQLMNSAEAMKSAVEYLEPMIKNEDAVEKKGVVVIATVKGDIHDIGKNLVAIMLKNCGFEVYDLGKNVEAEDIVEKAKQYKADIIGLSALMTTTMMEMKTVIDKVREAGLDTKIMIGGAAVTESFATEIGADAYSPDANDAVKKSLQLLGER